MHPDYYLFMLLFVAALAVLDLVISLVRWKPLVTFGLPGFVHRFTYQLPARDPLHVLSRLAAKDSKVRIKGMRFRKLDDSTLGFKEAYSLFGIAYTPLVRGVASVDIGERVVEVRGVFYWWILAFLGLFAMIADERGERTAGSNDLEFALTFWGIFGALFLLIYAMQWRRYRRVGRDILQMITGERDQP